jgi:hypothetical protein
MKDSVDRFSTQIREPKLLPELARGASLAWRLGEEEEEVNKGAA